MPAHDPDERCFACGKKLGKNPTLVDTRDAQLVYVGRECAKKVAQAGEAGWLPPSGGLRLYPIREGEQNATDR